MIEKNNERGGSWGILCTYAGALGMADEEIMKTRNSLSNGNVRGTRFSVFGMGLMSRLSGLSSSSCFVILGLEADTGSMGGGEGEVDAGKDGWRNTAGHRLPFQGT